MFHLLLNTNTDISTDKITDKIGDAAKQASEEVLQLGLTWLILIAVLAILFFILGNFLIVKGTQQNSPIKIIFGILLTGLFWGIAVWFIVNYTKKNNSSSKKKR